MLRLLNSTLAIAFALFFCSCDRDKQDDTASLEGTTWALRASIQATNGNVQFVSNTNPIEISFLKGKRYTFSSNSKSVQANYKLSPEGGYAKFSKPVKPTLFSHEANIYLATTLNATSYEIAGSSMKIANPTSNTFLVFERIK